MKRKKSPKVEIVNDISLAQIAACLRLALVGLFVLIPSYDTK